MGALKLKIKIRCKLDDKLRSEGRTKTWLAEQIGATPQMVNDWCKGRYTPSIGYIMRVMKATGWTIEDIFEEELE